MDVWRADDLADTDSVHSAQPILPSPIISGIPTSTSIAGAMDYSTSIHDADNPVGASPWGTSSSPVVSPQLNRNGNSNGNGNGNSFGGDPSSDNLPSPYRDTRSSDGQYSKSEINQNYNRPDTSSSFAGSVTDSSTDGGRRPGTQDSMLPPPQQSYEQRQAPSRQQSRQGPQYRLQAKITGLERTGRKDPVLRFDVYTNLPAFRTTQFRDVRRTHSEFIKLADHLISSNPEALVPAVPPALTSAGAGTDEDESRVKAHMQKWLNSVCANDVLMRDDEMILFVEGDSGYSPVVKRKQPATGVRRKVIKQFAPPPDDTPELQDARPAIKLFYLGTMDASHKVDKLVKARRAVGLAESDFGVKVGQMSVQEPHSGLANAYRKLGKTIQSAGDYHSAQGTAEATTLGDPLAYHSEDAFIVKETLTNRHILMRELVAAQQLTHAKLQAADRLKVSSSVKRDKVDEAISALDEARTNELFLAQKTQRITQNLLIEKRKWFANTTNDFRAAMREYVIRQIEAERRTLATLESIRPDIRSIDSSGGLSRLGREALPAQRRISTAQSQGPKGDAWSGVPRRPDGLNRSITGSSLAGVDEDGAEGAFVERKISAVGDAALGGVKKDEDDGDRVDARNAATRLATSTF